MSRFLAPIHYLVFDKIKAFEELEHIIIDELEASCNADINNLLEQLYQEYGNPLDDKPLEDIIDTDNIHGWLQNRIDIAEARHASLLSNTLSVYGDKCFHVIKKCYEEQGTQAGLDAKETKNVSSAPALYQSIKNYILDGMPCDQVDQIVLKQENYFQWKVTQCLHKKYWDNCDADINVFYQLREAWITQFVSNANPQFTYTFIQKTMNGVPTLIHEIAE